METFIQQKIGEGQKQLTEKECTNICKYFHLTQKEMQAHMSPVN